MAPINLNIPGHVAQSPTLTMAPHQTPAASTQDVTSTPWIFWVMMVLGGSLFTTIFGTFFFVLAKRSAFSIYNAVVYYANIIKDACLSVTSRFRVLLARRLRTKASKKSRDILPTSVSPYAPRPVILPNLKVSLTMPARAFGSSIREKVLDIHDGLLDKYDDWKEEREYKRAIAELPALLEQAHVDSRPTRNVREPRMPHWVSRFFERKPEQKLQIPEIKIWGPGEEPPRDTQDVQPEPAFDCTTEELMAFYGIDQAALDEICKKPWIVYEHKPLYKGKQTEGNDGVKGDNVVQKDKEASNNNLNVGINAGGANLVPPSEVVSLHSERGPASERSPVLDDNKDTSDLLATPPLSPDFDDSSSEGSCSPTTPDTAAFDAVPIIRIVEPTSPERNDTVHADVIFDTAVYGIPSLSATQSTSSHTIALNHCYPALKSIASVTDIFGSPPITPPLSPTPILISLSPTLPSDCYLHPPTRTYTAKERRRDSERNNKGKLFKLAPVPRRRPLIFTAGQSGVAQSVGIGREGVKKTKGQNKGHGLGLTDMPLGGIQEVEESEEDDKQVTAQAREDASSGVSAKIPKASTEYLVSDDTTDACDGRVATSALQSSIRKSNTGMEQRPLEPRPITDSVRTSTSSRRAPSHPNQVPGARPRFSISITTPQASPDLGRSENDKIGTTRKEAQKNRQAGSLTRSSSSPLRTITNSFSSRSSNKSYNTPTTISGQDKSQHSSTPPLPPHRFPPRSTSLKFLPRSSPSSRTVFTNTANVAVPTTKPSRARSGTVSGIPSNIAQSSSTSSSPPRTPPSLIPQPSSPSRTRSRKVVTKPPVPRYRPGGP